MAQNQPHFCLPDWVTAWKSLADARCGGKLNNKQHDKKDSRVRQLSDHDAWLLTSFYFLDYETESQE